MSLDFSLDGIPDYSDVNQLHELFTEVNKIGNLGHLCIHTKDAFQITYALYSGCPDMEQELIYKGYGYSDNLAEMRHTYFSNRGYMFYLPVPLLEASFKILRKYFKYDELS